MRHAAFLIVALALIAGAAATAHAGNLASTYGKGVSAADTTLVSRILATPDQFVGKTVRVEGTVVGVCAHRGCWINIASDHEAETIRIKVQDGQIVFPMELMGERVRAEGVFTANQLDLETTKKVCEHNAKKAGETFDPASVTSCMTLYQISGMGAVLLPREAKDKAEAGATPPAPAPATR